MGPLPIIATVSLGATRCFRIKRTQAVHLKGSLDKLGSGLDVSKIASIDVALQHNQLLIMWPPSQEAFT